MALTQEQKAENKKKREEEKAKENSQLLDLIKGVSDGLGNINTRLDDMQEQITVIKTGNKDAFKKEAVPADVESANETRKGVTDPKIVAIVDELLGVDFGIELTALGDRPGYMFTLVVPDRLNDNVLDMRPVRDPENENQYQKDALGRVVMQEYKLPDRRSRMLSTADGYDAIRQHCERVRAYIVAYYTKMSRPVPELKVQ